MDKQYYETDLPIHCNPPKITSIFFTKPNKINLKFIGNHRRPQIGKAMLRRKMSARSIPEFDLKYYRAMEAS